MKAEKRFLTLVYAGNFVDQSELGKGIYFKNIPDLHPIEATILGIEKEGRKLQLQLGKTYIPDSYFDNLRQCELVEVIIVMK